MTRSLQLLAVFAGLFLAGGLYPLAAAADGPPGSHTGLGENKGHVSYSGTIMTSRQGVWIQIRARGSYSGSYAAPSGASGVSFASAPGGAVGHGSSAAGAGSASTSSIARTWYNHVGEPYYETSNGTVYHLSGINIGFASSGKDGWFTVGSRQHPGSVPEALYVNGHFQGIVWVPLNGNSGNAQLAAAPSGSAAGAGNAPVVIDPRAVAMAVLAHIPLPNVVIRMNPSLGLVAMPGWFWAEGYNGEPFGGSATVGSFTVAVQVQPSSYTWRFGDGVSLVSHDLGQPYPAESDVQHTYQYSLLRYPDGFPIQLTIQFAASYSVNGGAATPLSSMARTYAASYRVQELQSILTNR